MYNPEVNGVEFTFTLEPSILNEALSTPFVSSASKTYVNGLVPPVVANVATTASGFTLEFPCRNSSDGVIVSPVISGSTPTFFLR